MNPHSICHGHSLGLQWLWCSLPMSHSELELIRVGLFHYLEHTRPCSTRLRCRFVHRKRLASLGSRLQGRCTCLCNTLPNLTPPVVWSWIDSKAWTWPCLAGLDSKMRYIWNMARLGWISLVHRSIRPFTCPFDKLKSKALCNQHPNSSPRHT